MGMKVAAVSVMCQDYRVYRAMMDAGTPCPIDGKIGEQAKEAWANQVSWLVPKPEEEKIDDTYKKVGIGAVLGLVIHKAFGF
jgi:hypothetical protein